MNKKIIALENPRKKCDEFWQKITCSNLLMGELIKSNFEACCEQTLTTCNDIQFGRRFSHYILNNRQLTSAQKKAFSRFLPTNYDLAFLHLELFHPFKPMYSKYIQLECSTSDTTNLYLLRKKVEQLLVLNEGLESCPDKGDINNTLNKIETKFKGRVIINIDTIKTMFKSLTASESSTQFFDQVFCDLQNPISLQDTGRGIYVGQTPNLLGSVFWEMMKEINGKYPEGNPIRIISLEASIEVEVQRREDLGFDREQILSKVHLQDPIYWPTPKNPRIGTSMDYKTQREIAPEVTNYSIDLIESTVTSPVILTHYNAWPDGSVPSRKNGELDALTNLVVSLAHEIHNSEQSTYIHCQQGLGRTGVVRIALEYALRKLEGETTLNPGELTMWYRTEHRYGIQTADQFEYLYKLCHEIDKTVA